MQYYKSSILQIKKLENEIKKITDQNNSLRKKYELELIKYWEDDLKILCGFHPMIDDSTYFRDERIKFWNLFKKKDIKAYALVNLSDNTGRKIDAEYPYDCGYLFGVIRLYETENERFIISFNWCD